MNRMDASIKTLSTIGSLSFCVIGLLVVMPSSTLAQQKGLPPGSFLRQPVNSVDELRKQASTDTVVMTRYTRLYKMSPKMVRLAFESLKLTRTKKDMVNEIYYVHTGEQIGYKIRKLKKGALVFSGGDGTPILVAACGNPIRRTAPVLSASPAVKTYSEDEPVVPAATADARTAYAMRTALPEDTLSAAAQSDLVLANDAVPADVPGPSFHESVPTPALRASSTGQLLAWAGGAAVAGTLIGAISSGGHGSAGTTDGSNGGANGGGSNGGADGSGGNGGGGGGTTTVAPEGDGIVLLLAGGSGLVAAGSVLRRRKKKQAPARPR